MFSPAVSAAGAFLVADALHTVHLMSEPAILTVDSDAWVSAVMTRGLRHHDGIGPLSPPAIGSAELAYLVHRHLATV